MSGTPKGTAGNSLPPVSPHGSWSHTHPRGQDPCNQLLYTFTFQPHEPHLYLLKLLYAIEFPPQNRTRILFSAYARFLFLKLTTTENNAIYRIYDMNYLRWAIWGAKMKKCTLDGAEIGNMIGKPLNSNQKCAPPECLLESGESLATLAFR